MADVVSRGTGPDEPAARSRVLVDRDARPTVSYRIAVVLMPVFELVALISWRQRCLRGE
jgi:hypothetical protein